jgi:nucleotide-binding universal stress UspA family protein
MPDKLTKILVPISDVKASEAGIDVACALAKRSKAKVYVVYVIEVKRALPVDAEIDAEMVQGEEVLSKAEHLAEQLDYEIETGLLQSREVGPAVVDEAAELGVDLIVMGVPYKRRFGEFDLGRTAPYVLKNAPCQVWICREPMEQGEKE